MQRLKATLMMVAAELVIAAFSVSYKLAADDGMHMKVLITYRYLFASILIFPLAFFLERFCSTLIFGLRSERLKSVKMQRLKAALMVIATKFIAAVFTIVYKLAVDDGMHIKVLIIYRYLIASILIFPLALFLERNKRPKLTWKILFQAFVCAIFGGPMSQNIYTRSLILTSATYAAAFTNLIPPLTFILAVLFRLEKVEMGKITGKAKVVGTLVGVGGAMILTFYKGHQLNIRSTHFNMLHSGQHMDGHMAATQKTSDHIFGSILALAYSLSIALYYIFQSILSANYPCHYSNTFLISVLGLIQSLAYALPTERSLSQWRLSTNIRLFSAFFQGICSLLAVFLVMAAVHLQGPLFASIFNPLVLVFVAIAGFLLLNEKLYVGSLLGSFVIIVGLYLVLWGKGKKTKRSPKLTPSSNLKDVNDVSNSIVNAVTPKTFVMPHTTNPQMVKQNDQEFVEEV